MSEEELDYLRGKVAALSMLCEALATLVASRSETIADEVDFRMTLSSQLPNLFTEFDDSLRGNSPAFNRGFSDGFNEVAEKLIT